MKIWQIVTVSVLALLVFLAAPLTLMAAGADPSDMAARPDLKGGLALVAPRTTVVGQEVSTGVFLRQDQTPVENAQIWAVSRDSLTTCKQAIKVLLKKGKNKFVPEHFQSILESNASLIGETDQAGKLLTSFNQPGNYGLVAYKPGYAPDWQILLVRNVIVIAGPDNATVGENVTFSLTEKSSGTAAAGIEVWAIDRPDMPSLKAALKKEMLDPKGDLVNADWQAILTAQALSLGVGDENGRVSAAFDESGQYIAFCVSQGRISGMTRLLIEAASPE